MQIIINDLIAVLGIGWTMVFACFIGKQIGRI